jgi:hypothetical protein
MALIRQLVGLLGRVISPVARPLPTQDNTNTEEKRTDIHASSGIRTHDSSVCAGEDTDYFCLKDIGSKYNSVHMQYVLKCKYNNVI